jgi:hypothetical protein
MNTKLFAIKLPEEEKNAMEYISNSTNNTLSSIFYKPLQDAIYKNLGLILLYKIDLRSTSRVPDMTKDAFSSEDLINKSLPIIEDFIGLMLDKKMRIDFWSIFAEIETNEKDLIFQNVNLAEIADHLGKEYLAQQGDFKELDLNLARHIFFNYMLTVYFNITAVGSIQRLNNEWSTHKHKLKEFQNQLINKYLTRFRNKKVEAIKIDEALEVSEYIE